MYNSLKKTKIQNIRSYNMISPDKILRWLEENVQSMRQSRRKTLSEIVSAATKMQGAGVLALGRALSGVVSAKHCIKRVWRFLRNPELEVEAVSRSLLRFLSSAEKRLAVLVDWTYLKSFKQLVFALPRDGRAFPFLSKTISGISEPGGMRVAEEEALKKLACICPEGKEVVLMGDRWFGHEIWLQRISNYGWFYVQRMKKNAFADFPNYIGSLKDMKLYPGDPVKDWGWGTITESKPFRTRLITVFGKNNQEPWYLVTNLKDLPTQIVRLYQRRMWIEAAFRDFKNESWGFGLKTVRLSESLRLDRLFIILALAYAFLCAMGAYAEKLKWDRLLKANTEKIRVISLLRIGYIISNRRKFKMSFAFKALQELPT
jgi:hypothetical protein